MAEVDIRRQAVEASPLEWRLQAFVAAYNAILILVIALLVGFIGFLGGVVTGGFLLVVGGVIAVFIVGYAAFCVCIAGGFWRRRVWARRAAIPVFLLYVLLCVAISKAPRTPLRPAPSYLNSQPVHHFPAGVEETERFLRTSFALLAWVNAFAIAHLLLRWRQFSHLQRRTVDSSLLRLDSVLLNYNPEPGAGRASNCWISFSNTDASISPTCRA